MLRGVGPVRYTVEFYGGGPKDGDVEPDARGPFPPSVCRVGFASGGTAWVDGRVDCDTVPAVVLDRYVRTAKQKHQHPLLVRYRHAGSGE